MDRQSDRPDPHLWASLRQRFPQLTQRGLYVVGGAVRDALLNREPVDIDLACLSAQKAAQDFASSSGGTLVSLGRDRFATWRVVTRHSFIIDFSELTEGRIDRDLARRDFTINAMALELFNDTFVDPFNGRSDLNGRILRMVAEQNLVEDPLRVLRGARLAAQFNLEIEGNTLKALARNAPAILDVAPERVRQELDALLSGDSIGLGLRILHESGLDRLLFGKSISDGDEPVLAHTNDRLSRFALLLRNLSESEIQSFTQRWRWSEADGKSLLHILKLVENVRRGPPLELALYDAGPQTTERAMSFLDALGDQELRDLVARILESNEGSLFQTTTLLTGEDIGSLLGQKPGPMIGRVKRALLEAQLDGRVRSRPQAEEFVRSKVSF